LTKLAPMLEASGRIGRYAVSSDLHRFLYANRSLQIQPITDDWNNGLSDQLRESLWYLVITDHGTRMKALKDIIDAGNLLVPGDVNHNGREVKVVVSVPSRDDSRKAAPEGAQQNPCQIFTSPSIAYVSHPAYAEPIRAGSRSFTFVLQFRIQPRTYEKGPSTLQETPADRYVDESEMEWFTPRYVQKQTACAY
jgi:hypothetical protein